MPEAVRRAFIAPDAASELIVRIADARRVLAPDQLRAFAMMLDGAIAQAAGTRASEIVSTVHTPAPVRLHVSTHRPKNAGTA